MLRKKKTNISSTRRRQPTATSTESFRRNNIVVSKSQRETAARQQSVTQRQYDLKKKLAYQKARNRLIVLLMLSLVIFIGYKMRITTVELTSNASTKLPAAEKLMYQNDLFELYKKHTIAGQVWLLDEDALRRDVTERYPEIEWIDISNSVPFRSALKADIRFRKPVFTWKDVSKVDLFVDSNGVLFDKNRDPTVKVATLIKIEDQSGVTLTAGTSVLTKNLIEFVGQLHTQIPPLYGPDAKVTRVVIPRSTREVQIQVTGKNYFIKLSSARSLEDQVGELGSLLQYFKASGVEPVEYVDLRVANKAFYK